MRSEITRLTRTAEERLRGDFLIVNNPVLSDGLALAPVIAASFTLRNAMILAAAGMALIIAMRVLSVIFIGRLPQRLRLLFCAVFAAVVYAPISWFLVKYYAMSVVSVGIYLPMLVCDSIVLAQCENKYQLPWLTSIWYSIKMALSFGFVTILIGALRELLGYNRIYGIPVAIGFRFSILGTTAGGFIIAALFCAVCRFLSNTKKRRVHMYSGVKENDN